MELRHLRYFAAVAEELHFGRAARRLHIAAPPLSQQIRNLEAELGVQLLARTKRRVRLTDVGRLFLEEARSTLAQADRAVRIVRRAGNGEIGQLAIGFVPAADLRVLPTVLPRFAKRFPDVQLILHLMNGALQVEALRGNRLHVGLLRLPVDDESLVVESILREPFVIALPERHRLTSYRRVPIRALTREPYIFFPRPLAPPLYDLIVSVCRQAGVILNVTHESDNMQTILSLIAAGLGVSLQPASIQHIQRKGVVYRPLRSPLLHAELGVAYKRDSDSAVLRAFLEVLREAASEGFG
jgi:DNA-binding transcriptional LysR family regulator